MFYDINCSILLIHDNNIISHHKNDSTSDIVHNNSNTTNYNRKAGTGDDVLYLLCLMFEHAHEVIFAFVDSAGSGYDTNSDIPLPISRNSGFTPN